MYPEPLMQKGASPGGNGQGVTALIEPLEDTAGSYPTVTPKASALRATERLGSPATGRRQPAQSGRGRRSELRLVRLVGVHQSEVHPVAEHLRPCARRVREVGAAEAALEPDGHRAEAAHGAH